jgi:hypothetical protein
MNSKNHLKFAPFHNVSALIHNDHTALAHQLRLCRTERSGWRHVETLIEGAQAFASQHLISMVLLLFAVTSVVSWLVE